MLPFLNLLCVCVHVVFIGHDFGWILLGGTYIETPKLVEKKQDPTHPGLDEEKMLPREVACK